MRKDTILSGFLKKLFQDDALPSASLRKRIEEAMVCSGSGALSTSKYLDNILYDGKVLEWRVGHSTVYGLPELDGRRIIKAQGLPFEKNKFSYSASHLNRVRSGEIAFGLMRTSQVSAIFIGKTHVQEYIEKRNEHDLTLRVLEAIEEGQDIKVVVDPRTKRKTLLSNGEPFDLEML